MLSLIHQAARFRAFILFSTLIIPLCLVLYNSASDIDEDNELEDIKIELGNVAQRAAQHPRPTLLS